MGSTKLVEWPGGGQRALALARLVHGAAVAQRLVVYVRLLGRLEPDDGHGIVQDLGELLRQDAPTKHHKSTF